MSTFCNDSVVETTSRTGSTVNRCKRPAWSLDLTDLSPDKWVTVVIGHGQRKVLVEMPGAFVNPAVPHFGKNWLEFVRFIPVCGDEMSHPMRWKVHLEDKMRVFGHCFVHLFRADRGFFYGSAQADVPPVWWYFQRLFLHDVSDLAFLYEYVQLKWVRRRHVGEGCGVNANWALDPNRFFINQNKPSLVVTSTLVNGLEAWQAKTPCLNLTIHARKLSLMT